MKKMKNEESEKTILYKQYQQNEVQSDELDAEEYNLEAEERKKNIIVYGMMGALGLFIIFLLVRNMYNKDTTTVIYKDAGSSNRVIKTNKEQITNTSEKEQNTEEYITDNISENTNTSGAGDLYEIAVENGFMGTREEFYELLNNWNYSSEELARNLDKLQDLIKQVEDSSGGEDGSDGEDGRDGKDGLNGRDGRDGQNGKDGVNGEDGKDGKDGKSAYEIAIENGFKGSETEWLRGISGETGKSAYEVAVENGFKGTEAEWLASLKGLDGNVAVEMWDPDTQTLYLIPME